MKSNPSLTLLSLVFAFLIFFLFNDNNYSIYLCILLSGVGIFFPQASKFIENIWFKIALVFSKFMPNLLLTIIFYFVLTPLALLRNLTKNQKSEKLYSKSESFFNTINKKYEKESFEKTW